MKLRSFLSILVGVCLIPAAALAADYALLSVFVADPARKELVVQFARPLPPTTDVVCTATPTQPCRWSVHVIVGEDPPVPVSVERSAIAIPAGGSADFGRDQRVQLTLATPIPADFVRVIVVFVRGNAPAAFMVKKSGPKPTPVVVPVDKASDATLYFSGLIAPAVKKETTFTIDAKAGWILGRFGDDKVPVSLSATAKGDKRPQVDLDSYSVSLTATNYAHRFVSRVDVPTLEFNRTGNVINLVGAGRIIAPLSHSVLRNVKDDNGNLVPTVKATFGFDPFVGVEGGANLRNAVSVAAGDEASSGIFRVLAGGYAFVSIPTPHLKKIIIGAEGIVRKPTTDELFLETRNLAPKADPVPHLDARIRPYGKLSVKFMATAWVGLELGYEYGSQPPAFKLGNHSGTIGIVFQAKQNERTR